MANDIAIEMHNMNTGDEEESDNEQENVEHEALNGSENGQSDSCDSVCVNGLQQSVAVAVYLHENKVLINLCWTYYVSFLDTFGAELKQQKIKKVILLLIITSPNVSVMLIK